MTPPAPSGTGSEGVMMKRRNSTLREPTGTASAAGSWLPWCLVVLGLAALVAASSWPVQAATDRFVAAGGSDTSNDCSNSGTPCATIQHAIGQAGSGDTITLGPGTYFENVTVSRSVTIQGDGTTGSTVNGSGAGTVFIINDATTVTLNTLTITNGTAQSGTFDQGGGIINFDTLTVIGCTINGNRAPNVTSFGHGGGIFNQGSLTVINSTISGNSADLGAVSLTPHLTRRRSSTAPSTVTRPQLTEAAASSTMGP